MMFLIHMAFGLALIALALGVFLYIWSDENDSGLGKAFGAIITILALLNVACNLYYGLRPMMGSQMPMQQNQQRMGGPGGPQGQEMGGSQQEQGKGGKMMQREKQSR